MVVLVKHLDRHAEPFDVLDTPLAGRVYVGHDALHKPPCAETGVDPEHVTHGPPAVEL